MLTFGIISQQKNIYFEFRKDMYEKIEMLKRINEITI